jgi:hypothetical protein
MSSKAHKQGMITTFKQAGEAEVTVVERVCPRVVEYDKFQTGVLLMWTLAKMIFDMYSASGLVTNVHLYHRYSRFADSLPSHFELEVRVGRTFEIIILTICFSVPVAEQL